MGACHTGNSSEDGSDVDGSDEDRRNDLAKAVQEAAYVAVGFGVLGFQRAQVRRRELARQLQDQRPELEQQLAGLVDDIRRVAAGAGEQIRARLRDSGRGDSGRGDSGRANGSAR